MKTTEFSNDFIDKMQDYGFEEIQSVTLHAAGITLTTDNEAKTNLPQQAYEVITVNCLFAKISSGALQLITSFTNSKTGETSTETSTHMGDIDVSYGIVESTSSEK